MANLRLNYFWLNIKDYSTLQIIPKRNVDLTSIPTQCIVLGESLIWSKNVAKLLETKKPEDLKYALKYFQRSIGELCNLQRTNIEPRIRDMYNSIILTFNYYKEVTQRK